MTSEQFEEATWAAYEALMRAETRDDKRALLRALKEPVLKALADNVYAEYQDDDPETVIEATVRAVCIT